MDFNKILIISGNTINHQTHTLIPVSDPECRSAYQEIKKDPRPEQVGLVTRDFLVFFPEKFLVKQPFTWTIAVPALALKAILLLPGQRRGEERLGMDLGVIVRAGSRTLHIPIAYNWSSIWNRFYNKVHLGHLPCTDLIWRCISSNNER